MISDNEKTRYQRQLLLPGFEEADQEKLKNSKVLILGAGGLGGPVSYYFAAAGVGQLIICDSDVVELSNLNRQILHSTKDIDKSKAESAYQTLNGLNPEIELEMHHCFVDAGNIEEIARGADLLVDCLDNIKTRHVLNEYAFQANIPLLHAGIDSWNGQITLIQPSQTACINCLFGDAEDSSEPKPVLGAVAGVVGTMQALEGIKVLLGKSSLVNQLLYFDALSLEWSKFAIQKDANCSVCNSSKS